MRRGGSRWRARDDGALTPRRGGDDDALTPRRGGVVGVASARTGFAAIAIVCAAIGSSGGGGAIGAAFGSGGGAACAAFGIGGGGSGVTAGSGGGEGDLSRMRTSRTGSSTLKSVDSECSTGTNGSGDGVNGSGGANAIGGGANETPRVGPVLANGRARGNPELVGPYSMNRMPMTPHPAAMHRRRRKVATCPLCATVRPGLNRGNSARSQREQPE